ncbi:amidohydrolase family protein [bacterium]|nr:amidohydrolase family protein [bacterium]
MKKFLAFFVLFAILFFAACDDNGGKNEEEIIDNDDQTDSEETDSDELSDTDEPDGDDATDTDKSDNDDTADTENEGDTDKPDNDKPDNDDTNDTEDEDDTDNDTTVIDAEDAPETVQCAELPALSGKTCDVTPGNGAKLIRGNILSGNKAYIGGEVLISEAGFIVCAGCDCSAEAAGATVVNCPGATVTPALINGHDHLGYVNNKPGDWKDERFDHRHDWRRGKNGHTKLDVPGSASAAQKQWAELRQLMAGTLAIAGSGGAKGFLRNIDQNFVDTLGLGGMDVQYQTFPLGDSNGFMLDSGCGYSKIDKESVLQADCYLPHVSEGINKAARNEFLCLTGRQDGGIDLAKENSAFVHSVGIIADDGKELADSKTAIIWSARTNISLYGNTAPVTMLKNQGVLIGLGTDWVASGSMHMLRELACVDYLNKNHFNKTFSDYEIWQMATVNNAAALRILDVTGAIRPGLVGDIVVFDAKGAENPYRAVIAGHEKKVALVLRGGQVFYGDENVVTALDTANECEAISVCDTDKKVCVKETGMTLSAFQSNNSSQYKLFYCETPDNEPTCVPQRTRSQDESRPYSGPKEGDKDGDGIADSEDNCPDIFNPIRPVDNDKQADSDGDGKGDACDPCPLKKGDECEKTPNPADKDDDGILNALDNCPFDKNTDQEDSDGNGIGDACDIAATTIYEIKQKNIAEGTTVKVEGIVTAYKSNNFFMQVDPADQDPVLKEQFSGIYVYKSTLEVNVGDKVRVSGKVMTYYDQLQIANVESVEIIKANKGVPDFVTVDPAKVKNGGSQKDTYNGVLVRVENVDVTEEADSYHVFGVANGLKVDDDFYSFKDPAVGTHFTEISGVLAYTFSYSKILPRFAKDYVIDNCGNSTCDTSWSECEPATGECIAKYGFCASKADCPDPEETCDTTTHECVDGDPCEGVSCEEYEECSKETGTCVAKDGKCISNSDCGTTEECNTTTHECEAAPIIRNGSFENGMTDWNGTKTNISDSNVSIVTDNVRTGTHALMLKSITSDNKRFTTQSIALTAGNYTCEAYAKGTAASAGFRVYSTNVEGNSSGYYPQTGFWFNINSNDWTKLTLAFKLNADDTDVQIVLFDAKNDSLLTYFDDVSCTKK